MKKSVLCLLMLMLLLMLCLGALQTQAFADGTAGGAPAAQNIVPGAVVRFGNYEQDNDASRKEPIDWYVLAVQGDTCLLLSRYALTRDFYHLGQEDVTWETSDIRAWLNSEFISEAFTQTEQSFLMETLVRNPDNPSDGTDGGNDTMDRVFLLSADEALTYFRSDAHRRCAQTAYAKEQEVLPFYASEYTLEGEPSVWWWLRTPGDQGNCAVGVKPDGDLFMGGGYCDTSQAVRPVIWVKMSGIESVDLTNPGDLIENDSDATVPVTDPGMPLPETVPGASARHADPFLLAKAFEAYAEIVCRYREAVRNYRACGIYPADDIIDRTAVETQNFGGTSDEELKAGLYDLNNDGIPELFFGSFDQHHFPQHQSIWAVYTYQDSHTVPVYISTSSDAQLSAQSAAGMEFFSDTFLLTFDREGTERYYTMSFYDASLLNTTKELADISKPVNCLYVLDMGLDYVQDETTEQKIQSGTIETKLRYYDLTLPQSSAREQDYVQQGWMKR